MLTKKSLSDDKLLSYNALGLVPGPFEDEMSFLSRCIECLNFKSQLTNKGKEFLPFKEEPFHEPFQESLDLTKRLFDCSPTWLPIVFSNYQLAPWHGGCAWIFQLEENGPKLAFLQLRKILLNQANYLKIYSRNELIAHEISHVGRMMFEENQYEEILAYCTSSSKWSRWFGPLVQSAAEAAFFILVIVLILIVDLYFLLTENFESYFYSMPLKLIPLGLLFYALVRLWLRHRKFNLALAKLNQALGDPNLANHVIYRLTDNEINRFALSSKDEIISYAKKQKDQSLRWKVIQQAYFKYLDNPISKSIQ